MACQRLRGLVATFPDRLDLRERLADVYRRRELPAEAGRWSYLAEDRDPVEVAAFEKSRLLAVDRMYALAWSQDPATASSPTARTLLEHVLEQARQQTGDKDLTYQNLRNPGGPPGTTWRDTLFVAAVLCVIALLLGLFVLGVVDGVRVVWSWLN